jgi:hypothetical protein
MSSSNLPAWSLIIKKSFFPVRETMMIPKKNAYLKRRLDGSCKDSIFQNYLIRRNKMIMTSILPKRINPLRKLIRGLSVKTNSMREDSHQIGKS